LQRFYVKYMKKYLNKWNCIQIYARRKENYQNNSTYIYIYTENVLKICNVLYDFIIENHN